jgi:hypothetical protein
MGVLPHDVGLFPDIIKLKQNIQSSILALEGIAPHYISHGQIQRNEFIPTGTYDAKLVPVSGLWMAQITFDKDGEKRTAQFSLGVKASRHDPEKAPDQKNRAQERLDDAVLDIIQANEDKRQITAYELSESLKIKYRKNWYKAEKGDYLSGYEAPIENYNNTILSAATLIMREDLNPTYVLQFQAQLANGETMGKAVNLHSDDIILAEERGADVIEAARKALLKASQHDMRSNFLAQYNAALPRYEHCVGVRVEEHIELENDRVLITLGLVRNPDKENSLSAFFNGSTNQEGHMLPVKVDIEFISKEPTDIELLTVTATDYLQSELRSHYARVTQDGRLAPEHTFKSARTVNCFNVATSKAANEINNIYIDASAPVSPFSAVR